MVGFLAVVRVVFVAFVAVFAAVIGCSVMQCPKPLGIIDSKTKIARYVPCGQCFVCRMNRAIDWALRLHVESRSYGDRQCFLTLTYDDDHNTGRLELDHVQKFFKRVRRAGYSVRYYLAGEYGSKSCRPHYHMILFGVPVDDSMFVDRCWDNRSHGWQCMCKYWIFGHVFVGYVEPLSILYTTKYILKSVTGKGAKSAYDDKGLTRPFSTMSRNPGLGSSVDLHWLLTNNHYHLKEGLDWPKLPRFYVDMIYPKGTLDRAIRDCDMHDYMVENAPDWDKRALARQLLLELERKAEVKHDRSVN